MGFAIQNMHRGKKIGVPKTIGTENLDLNLPLASFEVKREGKKTQH
jgi:hypothetical protein